MILPLIRKFEQLAPLTEAEKQALRTAPVRMHEVAARHDVVSEGAHPTDVHLIVEGFACRYKLLPSGQRQILSFLIVGDFCDLRAILLRQMDHGVVALSRSQIAVITHQRLFEIIEKYPRIALALWRDTMIDAAIYRQWLTNVGRRPAYARIAHLLCEIRSRLEVVGLTRGGSYDLPMTQTDIGDAMGLSVVHVNRTLQQLRADGLITFRANVVSVLDWPRLTAAGEFDSSYLHLPQSARAAAPVGGERIT